MKWNTGILVFLCIGGFAACSSARPIRTQAYARLSDHKVFEYEFPVVWKAIEAATRGFKIVERQPDEVDPVELRKLTRRKLVTDWVYSQSREKYVEYSVNDSPRKQYLQTRVKYTITAQSQIGGTQVEVRLDEEVERLKADGTPEGYESMPSETSRAQEMVEKVGNSILSAAP